MVLGQVNRLEPVHRRFPGTGGLPLVGRGRLAQDESPAVGRAQDVGQIGINRPDWPKITLGYEYRFRDGTKPTLHWGPSLQGGETRKILPAYKSIEEDVHIVRAKVRYEPLRLAKACWVECEDEKALKEFKARRKRDLADDKEGRLVYLAETPWSLQMARENHPEVTFHEVSEF